MTADSTYLLTGDALLLRGSLLSNPATVLGGQGTLGRGAAAAARTSRAGAPVVALAQDAEALLGRLSRHSQVSGDFVPVDVRTRVHVVEHCLQEAGLGLAESGGAALGVGILLGRHIAFWSDAV